MKQIRVNEKCNGCGLCIVNCPYLRENAEGNAEVISGKSISDGDWKLVKKVIKECPENALEIIETGMTSKQGADGIKDIILNLKKKCDVFSVNKVVRADVKLDSKAYPISAPYSFKNGNYKYKSESEAKSAAREEFRKYCYAESAYRPMLKKVFVAYKMNVLKPYFTCTDTEDSAFYVYNCQIRKLLSDTYAEIEYIMGNNTLPESWKDFSVYLPENDICVGVVANFDERSTNSGIISELKSISSLDSYVSEMDINYLEEYAGEGMFGSIKFKKKWGFDNFFAASESFVKDLTWAIGYMSSDIEDGAVSCVNSVLVEFEKKVKEELKKKISELEKCIN